MRLIIFEFNAFKQYQEWIKTDKKISLRISSLILEIAKSPFTGRGKPELLKGDFKGYWSRRIDNEHRLIYKVTEDSIIIALCYSHYNDK
ncbi:MAG TPA: Txe/YoeB family addiction module toxin [Segetibacter sp.]|nr:Txe/YoeB family addiction module toxin [Segetibacter sp.]